jgi:hypothetical protein
MKKLPLALVLAFATVFMVACGDDKDPRISDADAVCLKVLRAGGTCGNMNGGGGATTATTTSTVTVTQTN